MRLIHTGVLVLGLVAVVFVGFGKQASGAVSSWKAILLSGGSLPSSNAIAHEKNILFAERTLKSAGLPAASISPYMSVGTEPLPDVSYIGDVPQDRWELSVLDRLFGRGGVDLSYRHNQVTDVAGPARRGDILQAIREATSRMGRSDSLFLYSTDHGSPGENADGGKNENDNYVVLWGNDRLSTNDVRQALDAGPQAGRVVLLMAQCYSGSFANVMWKPGNRQLASQDRCGFFAATASREAAGCTPEIDEADYDDYSTRMFSALGGKDRSGKPVPSADYDRDGRVSFSEAHAYAVGTEETIDVPVKTSEIYLEQSKLPLNADWETSLHGALPEEQTAWMMLSGRLGLGAGDPRSAVEKGLRKARKRMEFLRRERDKLDVELQGYEEDLRLALLERWPIIDTPYHPQFAALMKNGDQIRKFLTKHPSFVRWQSLMGSVNNVEGEMLAAQIQEAWWLRADRLAKHMRREVAAARDPIHQQALGRLRSCELSSPGR